MSAVSFKLSNAFTSWLCPLEKTLYAAAAKGSGRRDTGGLKYINYKFKMAMIIEQEKCYPSS